MMHPTQKRQENSRIRRHSGVASSQIAASRQAVTFSSLFPSLSCQLGCTNWRTGNRNGTTKNHVSRLTNSCHPNTFFLQKIHIDLLTYCKLTVPDTGHDSRGLQGEVGGCRSLSSPDIDLEQIPDFAYRPPRATSKGRCPEMSQ